MPNALIIGSSSETTYGVGSLLKFDAEQVISTYFDEENGEWIIEERLEDGGFKIYKCYEVMKLEGGPFCSIEESDLKGAD